MRIIFKILAAPFIVILTLLWAVLTFLFCWAKMLLTFASGISMLLAIALFLTGQMTGGIVFTVVAFLISPLGIPAIAEWLVVRLGVLNYSLRDFITS